MYFFNQKDSFKNVIQAWNLIALGLNVYQMTTEPERYLELGFEALSHGASFLSLRETTPFYVGLATSALNCANAGAIYQSIVSGCHTLPFPLGPMIACLNIATAVVGLDTGLDDVTQEPPKAKVA